VFKARMALGDDAAATRLQCAGRMFFARREAKLLRTELEEEQRWRQALQRRRARIERLERELRHVEELPASDIERYTSGARYGLNNKLASARTIQGAWRAVRRARHRRQRLADAREKAVRKIQGFLRRRQRKRQQRAKAGDRPPKLAPTKSASAQREDDAAPELPSMQRVRELQAQVTKHLEERRREPSRTKFTDEHLKDLSQRVESAIGSYRGLQAHARRDARERLELRDATASFFSSLWTCKGMGQLLKDRQLDALSKGQGWTAITGAGAEGEEYKELLMSAALREHEALSAAFLTRRS